MPDQTKNSGFFQFATGDLSASELRAKLLQGQGEAAVLGAMTEALDLYAFMSTLPDAFIASQKREAQRLEKLSSEKGPRMEALKASMAQAAQMNATAQWGKARVDRVMATALEPNDVFHGFVSGPELQMRMGYTVRLMGAEGKALLSAVTQADGYFTMTLKENQKSNPLASKDDAQTAMLGEMLQLLGMSSSAAASKFQNAMNAGVQPTGPKEMPDTGQQASAEILDASGEVVQQDPIPLDLDGGTVYREYVVAGKAGDTALRRYIGNSAKFELHDSQTLTKQCNVDAMRESHKVYFDSTEAAEKAGYDYCAYCFGKKMSKR